MGAARKLNEGIDFQTGTELRRSPRADAYLCVDMWSGHVLFTGLTMNISEGGLFVATEMMLRAGSLIGLHLELPKCSRRILTLGEVRWVREFGGKGEVPPGLGIEFVGLDSPSQAAIGEFVGSQLQRFTHFTH